MKRKQSGYWFFRSFFISFVLFLCAEALLLGMGQCYSIMETNLKGERISLIEISGEQVKVLGHIVKE